MPGGGKSDVKLGFFVGIGLLLAFMLGGFLQSFLGRLRNAG